MARTCVMLGALIALAAGGPAGAAEPTLKWTYDVGSAIHSSPAIQDIDADGKQEVLIAGARGSLHCVGADGQPKWIFYLPEGSDVRSSPSIGDLDADGVPEILIGGSDGALYCLRPNGELKWRAQLPDYIRRSACASQGIEPASPLTRKGRPSAFPLPREEARCTANLD